jgi:glucan 1,3-beta-glucosidase
MLVEATQGTWLVGTAMEHHTLYQYNFHSAQNVFSGFQQSETAYWQGSNGVDFAPAPWSSNLISSDPTFSNCATTDGGCRMGWFEMIQLSSNIFLYGGCVWTFYNANQPCQGDCQQNAVYVEASASLYLYGTNVKTITNIIYQDGVDYATEIGNGGGWGGVVAVYQDLYGVPNGNAVSGAGFSWYDPTFTDGNAGYADPQYYYCFNGPASNFPPFQNWMNFYDMFDLNQKTSMASEEQGPIQGDIYNAIVELSQASLVDARLILAIVMQEVKRRSLPSLPLDETRD